ncbi:Pseudopilin GspJ [compost metagenome]
MLGGERDNQPLPRSDLRLVEYWLADGVLWRQRRTLEHGQVRPQRLLEGIVELRWRLHVADSGWLSRWPLARQHRAPQALEVTLSTERSR